MTATMALCSTCLRRVDGEVIEHAGSVYLDKFCPEHGKERVLRETDAEWYRQTQTMFGAPNAPLKFNTRRKHGCPYDCGLCTEHQQHSCVALVEVTQTCNLKCPVCYSNSSPETGPHHTLEHIERMFDAIVANEGEPAVVQLSGGEPTTHPRIFDILEAARRRPIRHLMLNTNGLRIAEDREFARRLATFLPGFEVYLQFDSLRDSTLRRIRGANLADLRRRALEHLNAFNISTTLVVVVEKGLNDGEMGEVLDYARTQRCVRGVTFQPIQAEGRVENYDPVRHRLTVSDVRRGIVEQQALFVAQDIVPVPCHPECIAMAYALKVGDEMIPLTRHVDPRLLAESSESTIAFEKNEELKSTLLGLLSASATPKATESNLGRLFCCLPSIRAPQDLSYENVFRIVIMKFLDRYDMEEKSVARACVHVVHTDGRIIPLDTYNLFYRKGQEQVLKTALAKSGCATIDSGNQR